MLRLSKQSRAVAITAPTVKSGWKKNDIEVAFVKAILNDINILPWKYVIIHIIFRAFFMKDEIKYMKLALKLARKGAGWVNPNPMVGAVIVKNNTIIGKGCHEHFGGPHAEVNAINACVQSPCDATLYINLEPCAHTGNTPPCVDLIVEKGIRKVVIAMKDPNPKVNGKGIEFLLNHNIIVETGLLADEAAELNETFIKFITTRKPFCLYKGAMTLDGKIASATGDSRWISGEASRKLAHRLRHEYSAIMVGIGTVLKDNPKLDARRSRKISKNPLKVVVDSIARIPLELNDRLSIQIQGHTDAIGNDAANLILSENRAKSVYDYLIANDVPASRLTYKGFGETDPLATNDTEEGRAMNRRTCFVITQK